MTANDCDVQLPSATARMGLRRTRETTYLECSHTGTSPIVTPAHGFQGLETMLKAYEPGRDRRAKGIESIFMQPSLSDRIETAKG